MSFASEVKNELCRVPVSRHCCAVAEAYGVLLYCHTFTTREIRIVTACDAFAERLPKLFRRAFGAHFALPAGEKAGGRHVLTITDRAADYCAQQAAELRKQGFRVEVDSRNEKVGKKIREATLEKIPYMLVVGDRDMEAGTVSVRTRTGEDLGAMSLADFSRLLRDVVDSKARK